MHLFLSIYQSMLDISEEKKQKQKWCNTEYMHLYYAWTKNLGLKKQKVNDVLQSVSYSFAVQRGTHNKFLQL